MYADLVISEPMSQAKRRLENLREEVPQVQALAGLMQTSGPQTRSQATSVTDDVEVVRQATILEILATSTRSDLKEHFHRTQEYAKSLKKELVLRDVWIVHFTREDNVIMEPQWPSEEQQANLNTVVFWHNRDFTEVRMSAFWKEYENDVMHEIIDEVVCNNNYSAD
jgi:hypothetical protein